MGQYLLRVGNVGCQNVGKTDQNILQHWYQIFKVTGRLESRKVLKWSMLKFEYLKKYNWKVNKSFVSNDENLVKI